MIVFGVRMPLEETQRLVMVGDNAFHNPTVVDWLQQHRDIARAALPRRTRAQP